MPDVHVFPDAAALQQAAARYVVELAAEAIGARGRFSLVLSGGSTPKGLYQLLAQPPFSQQVNWGRTHVFWGDERYVPHDDADSCYRMAHEALLAHVPLLAAQVYPMPTSAADPQRDAAAYEQELRSFFGHEGMGSFDLVLLGMGPDGHTASLFPQHPALGATPDTLVVVVDDAPKPPPLRLSLTLPVLNAARRVLFLVTGADKAAPFQQIMDGAADSDLLPAGQVQPGDGAVVWMVDQQVAGKQEL